MAHNHVCPPTHVWMIDNFLRRWIHSPKRLFSDYVKLGATVLDVGCGGGFTVMGLARLVGPQGRVIAVDLQEEMLAMVGKRAKREGMAERVQLHRCEKEGIGVEVSVDFANAFYMVHETPDKEVFLQEIFSLMKPGAHFFIAEPAFHVTESAFEAMITQAQGIGYAVAARPKVKFSQAVVLQRP